jgi:hypothetical protein
MLSPKKVIRQHSKVFRNERGLAVLEMIPVIIVVGVMLRYSYGFFGVIHSATLQSIAARNYAFETFRHRSNLSILREGTYRADYRYKLGARLHGIKDERFPSLGDPKWEPSLRPITFPGDLKDTVGSNSFSARKNEQNKLTSPDAKYDRDVGEGVNSVWLAIRYGMCLDHRCGD